MDLGWIYMFMKYSYLAMTYVYVFIHISNFDTFECRDHLKHHELKLE